MRRKETSKRSLWFSMAFCALAVCIVAVVTYALFRHKTTTITMPQESTKTYCEPETNGCFNYPTAWTKPTRSAVGYSVSVAFGNTDNTASGQYLFAPDSPAPNSTFYTFSSRQLIASGRTVDLIGGYFTEGLAAHGGEPTTPAYYLVDASQAQQYGLTPGAGSRTTTSLGIKLASGWIVRLSCGAGAQSSATGAAWFNTSDARTCANIVTSLRFR